VAKSVDVAVEQRFSNETLKHFFVLSETAPPTVISGKPNIHHGSK